MEPLVWLYVAVLLVAPPTIFLAYYVGSINERRRRMLQLDALWAWVGEGRDLHGEGRGWVGEIDGRRVDVDWFDDNTTVQVDARPHVHVGFGRGDQPPDLVDGARDGRPVPIDLGEVAYAERPEEVAALVRVPRVKDALDVLLEDDGGSLRKVEVDPVHGVSWFARNLPVGFTREDTERWVRAVLVVARAAEAV